MQLTFPESLHEVLRGRLTRRGAAVVLALAFEVLVIILFMTISSGFKPKERPKTKVFQVVEEPKKKPAPPIEIAKQESRRANGGGSKPAQSPNEVISPTPPVPPQANLPSNVLWLSSSQYRSTDITGKRGTVDGPGQGNGTSAEPDSALADGRGPHGEPLYAAEWYREPSDRELSPYIPERARGRGGWGEIACRTVEHYRVEDCQELADAPRGSGYAGAIRQAAFQFRVRPPRVGGRSLVGSWVRIRITYRVEVLRRGDTARPGPQSDDDKPDQPDNQ